MFSPLPLLFFKLLPHDVSALRVVVTGGSSGRHIVSKELAVAAGAVATWMLPRGAVAGAVGRVQGAISTVPITGQA